jgi:hypothetical protein
MASSRLGINLVRITRVRRCAEEAKGGLELAWPADVALALQRLCKNGPPAPHPVDAAQRGGSGSGGGGGPADTDAAAYTIPLMPPLFVEIMGHTTPAVADIGRASIRVRFCSPTTEETTSAGGAATTSAHADRDTALTFPPTGGLLLGIRRQGLARPIIDMLPPRLLSFL